MVRSCVGARRPRPTLPRPPPCARLQEYESEGIDWTKVEFTDNQSCVDVIELAPPKGLGVLSVLDSQCRHVPPPRERAQCRPVLHDTQYATNTLGLPIPSRYAEFESRFARGRTNRVRAR